MTGRVSRRAAFVCVAACVIAGAAQAETVEEFYRGKTIQFVIRSKAGAGGYDSYARLLGRHIGRHIPGHPAVVPVNMPGGGGIVAANYVNKIAPKDGTVLAIVSQGLAVDQALGLSKSLTVDLRRFNWVGNMSDSNQITAVWHTSKTKTLADAMQRVTTIGTTGAGSISQQLPAIYNNILGTKIKIVAGYPDGHDVDLAMEREEVEGRGTNPWASYVAVSPHYVKEKLIIPLIQVGLRKEPDLPDVPLLRDLARTPQDKSVLDFMSQSVAVGRPIATTPDVPPERVEALRRAFDATLKDPAFIAEAEKERADISPMTGEVLADLVRSLIEAPEDIKARVRDAIQPRSEDMTKLAGAKKAED